MTEIHTTTARRTRGRYAVLSRKARPIVAAFVPGDIIELRESGCRTRFTLPIDAAFRIAIRQKVEADRRARREARSKK